MLVLSRKPEEKIRIGTDIIINVISISEGQVRIGIEAPPNMKIYREEIYNKLKESLVDAVTSSKEVNLSELSKLTLNDINKEDEDGNRK
jgi:carbon storage regulator